jgi:hypothetical protein
MSHYLVDVHSNPLSGARVLDVTDPPDGRSLMNGGSIIFVPNYVSVQDPTGVADLITKKYQGLLAYYAGFGNIVYDDLLDTLGVDFGNPGLKGSFGDRGAITLPRTGFFSSLPVALGSPPAQAIITWDSYTTTCDTATTTDRTLRHYKEASSGPSNWTCQVSFDGGLHYYPTTDGAVLNIPVVGRGTSFVLHLTNISGDKLGLGSWALIY